MEIILLERVEKLGQMGQVVKVAAGYARNFLLPTRKALRATKENLAKFAEQKAHLEAQNLKKRGDAEYASKALEGLVISLIRQASETGHLYGSVRSKDVADEMNNRGVSISRNQIHIPLPIKNRGIHEAVVVLHPEVRVSIKINVAQSEEEASVQLENLDA